MAQKYAFYELIKVKGKKEYIPRPRGTAYSSISAAYRLLDKYWEDRFDYPGWYNEKIQEEVWHERDENLIYVPNYKGEKDEDGVLRQKLVGIYDRRPVYCIDEFPNPYSRYKVHKKGDTMYLEGIE